MEQADDSEDGSEGEMSGNSAAGPSMGKGKGKGKEKATAKKGNNRELKTSAMNIRLTKCYSSGVVQPASKSRKRPASDLSDSERNDEEQVVHLREKRAKTQMVGQDVVSGNTDDDPRQVEGLGMQSPSTLTFCISPLAH